MSRYLCRCSAVTAVLLLIGRAAFAQGIMPPRSPQGLFGRNGTDPRATTRLDFGVAIVEGYDQDVPTSLVPTIDAASLQSGGYTTMLNATLEYARRMNRVDLGANAASTVRHDSELQGTRSAGHSAGVGMSARLPGRTTFFVNQAANYSPTYMYALFPVSTDLTPGDARSPSPDFTVSTFESYVYDTRLSVKKDFTNRRSVDLTGTYSYTDRLHESLEWSDVNRYTVAGTYLQRLARNAAITSAVRYQSGSFGYTANGTTTEMGVDVGLDYARPLSATRRLTLRFDIGMAGTDLPESATGIVGLERQYRATSNVAFGYQFSRSWELRTNVRRGFEYVADLPTPVFAQGFSTSIEGLLSRRVDVLGSVAYSDGESALNRTGLQYDTYAGRMRARFALSRTVATYVEYLYYYYDFRGTLKLLPGIPSGLERNGGRVGLTLWVPALRR